MFGNIIPLAFGFLFLSVHFSSVLYCVLWLCFLYVVITIAKYVFEYVKHTSIGICLFICLPNIFSLTCSKRKENVLICSFYSFFFSFLSMFTANQFIFSSSSVWLHVVEFGVKWNESKNENTLCVLCTLYKCLCVHELLL